MSEHFDEEYEMEADWEPSTELKAESAFVLLADLRGEGMFSEDHLPHVELVIQLCREIAGEEITAH